MTTGVSTRRFRELLAAGPVHAGGCYDALTAKLVEEVGYPAAYISGLAVEATQLASADIGLITRTEMVTHAQRIASAVDIPVICDADTGYGDVVNLGRTVREFERAGIAAIQIEDQTDPKKCPLLGSPDLIAADAAARRIEAAAESRTDPDFVIIGRTDAYEISFDEVVRRSNLYLRAGADIVMSPLKVVDGVPMASLDADSQMAWHTRYCAAVEGDVLGMHVPAGRTVADLHAAGYRVVVLPTVGLQAAATAVRAILAQTLDTGTAAGYFAAHPRDERVVGEGLLRMLGAERAAELQQRFAPGDGRPVHPGAAVAEDR
jgi:2,3-dimethylmalate lyase